jgi:hypothetical protein
VAINLLVGGDGESVLLSTLAEWKPAQLTTVINITVIISATTIQIISINHHHLNRPPAPAVNSTHLLHRHHSSSSIIARHSSSFSFSLYCCSKV